jgi:hypothetical protein
VEALKSSLILDHRCCDGMRVGAFTRIPTLAGQSRLSAAVYQYQVKVVHVRSSRLKMTTEGDDLCG